MLRSPSLRVLVLASALATGCGSETPGSGSGGSPSAGSGPTTGTTTASGSGGHVTPAGPHLVVPDVIDVPAVVAGMGGTSASVEVRNDGDAPLTPIDWKLSGDPSLTLAGAPASLGPGEHAMITVTYAGAPAEAIASATLAVSSPAGGRVVPVFAAAVDPGLGQAAWTDVIGAGGVIAGEGVTVDMPAAPYPYGNSSFVDPSVHVFLPEGYRERGTQDLVVHFHGWGTTVDATLADHRYREHLYASGANAVLVVPQGPVNAPSGDFGKLMVPGGLAALAREVIVLLYREGRIQYPVLGDVVLTSHSGGYKAVATNLDPKSLGPPVAQVDLFDSLYGYQSTYESFALGGGLLRSNYTANGGTVAANQEVASWLAANGVPPADRVTQRTLRDDAPVIAFADTSHNGSTRLEGAYGEMLRWRRPHSRHGPRIELRQAVVKGGVADVRWLAPPDEDVTGFVVETSADGDTWKIAATVGAASDQASFPLAGGGVRVRVKPAVNGVDDVLPSDTYRVDAAPSVLIVDGFDRVLDGSFGGLHHDFAAVVGESAGAVASVSNEAVTEDGFDLTAFPVVVWLLGDESSADRSLSPDEQQILLDYLAAGGSLIVSGSDTAWDLAGSASGATFLEQCFGAELLADDSGSLAASGEGPLAGVAGFTYAGPGAPYAEDWPDALTAAPSGEVLLRYGSGSAAAVGIAGQAALVGFPLELVDSDADRASVVKALVAYVSN
jgi:hypothetical protein